MGGFGSGRHGGKALTSDYRALDVRQLGRDGLLARAWASLPLEMDVRRRNRGIHPRVDGSRSGDPYLSPSKRRWRVEGRKMSGANGLDALRLWRAAGVVPLPDLRLRAARGPALRGAYLRLSALPQVGLRVPAGKRRVSSDGAWEQNPPAAGMGLGHAERHGLEAEGDARAHLRAALCQT